MPAATAGLACATAGLAVGAIPAAGLAAWATGFLTAPAAAVGRAASATTGFAAIFTAAAFTGAADAAGFFMGVMTLPLGAARATGFGACRLGSRTQSASLPSWLPRSASCCDFLSVDARATAFTALCPWQQPWSQTSSSGPSRLSPSHTTSRTTRFNVQLYSSAAVTALLRTSETVRERSPSNFKANAATILPSCLEAIDASHLQATGSRTATPFPGQGIPGRTTSAFFRIAKSCSPFHLPDPARQYENASIQADLHGPVAIPSPCCMFPFGYDMQSCNTKFTGNEGP